MHSALVLDKQVLSVEALVADVTAVGPISYGYNLKRENELYLS